MFENLKSEITPLKQKAEESGAKSLDNYSLAAGKYDQGLKNSQEKEYDLSISNLKESKELFQKLLDEYSASQQTNEIATKYNDLKAQATTLMEYLNIIYDFSDHQLFTSAQSKLSQSESLILNEDYETANSLLSSALGELNSLSKSEVDVTTGSTDTQIESALALCRQYSEHCDRTWYQSERLKSVNLKPFVIDETEVTNREFAEFAQNKGYVTSAERAGKSFVLDNGQSISVDGINWKNLDEKGTSYLNKLDHPVVHVSQADADAYCKWAGKRLPTESEWEFSARGRNNDLFPWGKNWNANDLALFNESSTGTSPVGSYPGGDTALGVKDMAGNVWELTSTIEDDKVVLKGGSWLENNPANFRTSVRRTEKPSNTHSDDGFRCVKDIKSWVEVF